MLQMKAASYLKQCLTLCVCVQVAQAPRAAAPRVQAMAELDQGWLPSKAAADDINLSLLTACLLPSEQVGRHAGTESRFFCWLQGGQHLAGWPYTTVKGNLIVGGLRHRRHPMQLAAWDALQGAAWDSTSTAVLLARVTRRDTCTLFPEVVELQLSGGRNCLTCFDLSLLTACLLPSEQVGRHAGTRYSV
jgi:hypothetical protein